MKGTAPSVARNLEAREANPTYPSRSMQYEWPGGHHPGLVRSLYLARTAPHSAQVRCRSSAALDFKEGQEAAGSAAKPGGEPMLARNV